MVGQEFGFKFAADEASIARLRRCPDLKAQTVGPVRTRRVLSVYHDTTDNRLFDAGIAWQVKRQGRAWQQTVRPINGAGALHGEAATPLRGPEPDPGAVLDPNIAGTLKDVLRDKMIGPRVATDITRTERRLITLRGDIVELALHSADVTAGDAKEHAFSVELELKAGAPSSLIEIARRLAKDMQLELSFVTSAERGFLLLKGLPPGKAPWVTLPRDASATEALRAIISSCLRHIALHAAEARHGERTEALHQIRVGLRRLRAVLKDYARAFQSDELASLADRARDLATLLGPARDFDVFLSEIVTPAEKAVTFPDALALLARNARARRDAAWATARAALDHPDYRVFLIDVAAVALTGPHSNARDVTPPAAMPARLLVLDVLDRRLAKTKDLAERLAMLSIEERHELRKDLKKLRYPAEFFASLFAGKTLKKFFGCLSDLQDDLGRLNDLATARRLLQDLVASVAADEPASAVPLAMTAGEIVGWHAHKADRALKRVAKHWAKFEDAGPFWRKG